MEFNISQMHPEYNFVVTGASYAGAPRSSTAMYISKKVEHLLVNLDKVENCVVFVETGMEIASALKAKNAFVVSDNPQLSYATFAEQFEKAILLEERRGKFEHRADGTAISESASIGEGSYIEPHCFIGPNVIIGKNAFIHTGTIIKNAVIGDDFICNESAIIGSDSFTMAVDMNGNKLRIPSLGRVIIKDHVEIGAFNNIARGACGDTILEDYVKLDALIHVGHEVHLCKNVEVTAGATIAGFVTAGEASYIGVNACFRNRITIGENCVIGMGSTVTKNVDANVTVAGNPARLFAKNK